MNCAYFVIYPKTIQDLQKAHIMERERGYQIVRVMTLPAIDYKNFITDMVVERQFLEDSAAFCSESEPMKCLLVRQHGKRHGILVVPDIPIYKEYVKWAAYVSQVE